VHAHQSAEPEDGRLLRSQFIPPDEGYFGMELLPEWAAADKATMKLT
jgi:hypothetical protein